MKQRDTNRLNMIRTTLLWCTDNASATAGIPAFANVKNTVETKLSMIDQLNQKAKAGSKGVTIDTNVSRANMQNIAFKCASAVSAYAASIKNNTLRVKVRYSLNAMAAKKKEEIDDICQTIHDEANNNFASATGFGYTNTNVTDLQTAINLCRDSMSNPRQAIISHSVALETIRTQIREILNTHFKELMDAMVHTLIISNPNFVSGYFHAREIIDLGTTHTKVGGTVTDKNGTFLQGVTFSARKTTAVGATLAVAQSSGAVAPANMTARVRSDSKGKYIIPKFPPGIYDFLWEHPNYQSKTETSVHIKPGKEIRRRITLILL